MHHIPSVHLSHLAVLDARVDLVRARLEARRAAALRWQRHPVARWLLAGLLLGLLAVLAWGIA